MKLKNSKFNQKIIQYNKIQCKILKTKINNWNKLLNSHKMLNINVQSIQQNL